MTTKFDYGPGPHYPVHAYAGFPGDRRLEEVAAVLAKFTYQRKLRAIVDEKFGGLCVTTYAQVRDAEGCGDLMGDFEVSLQRTLHWDADEASLRVFFENAIWELEEHEFREFLRFDGTPVTDPHPGLAPQKTTLVFRNFDRQEHVFYDDGPQLKYVNCRCADEDCPVCDVRELHDREQVSGGDREGPDGGGG